MGSPVYNGVMRGITLNGVILLGTTLGGRDVTGDQPPEPSAAELARGLPGLAVTAAFHGMTAFSGQGTAKVYAEARAFADSTYAAALEKLKAGNLGLAERNSTRAQLQAFTSLTPAQIGDDLHIDPREFAKLILKSRGLETGMYDSRYTLPLANSGGDPVADDPAMGRYVPGFVAAFNEMIRDDLKVDTGRPYQAIYWRDLLASWNWERRGVAPGQSFAVDLAWAMRRTPALRLFVASGYFDLVTMPTDAFVELAQANLPSDRVRFGRIRVRPHALSRRHIRAVLRRTCASSSPETSDQAVPTAARKASISSAVLNTDTVGRKRWRDSVVTILAAFILSDSFL